MGEPVYQVLLHGIMPLAEMYLSAEEWEKFKPVGVLTPLEGA